MHVQLLARFATMQHVVGVPATAPRSEAAIIQANGVSIALILQLLSCFTLARGARLIKLHHNLLLMNLPWLWLWSQPLSRVG